MAADINNISEQTKDGVSALHTVLFLFKAVLGCENGIYIIIIIFKPVIVKVCL